MLRLGTSAATIGCLLCLSLCLSAQQTDYERARKILQQSPRPVQALLTHTQTFPDDPWSHHFLAAARKEVGQLDEALASLDRAIKLDPEQALHWSLKGDVLRGRSDHDATESAYRKAGRLDDRADARDFYEKQAAAAADKRAHSQGLLQRSWIALAVGVLLAVAAAFKLTRR